MAHGTRALVACAGRVKWKTQGRCSCNITGPRFKRCGGNGAAGLQITPHDMVKIGELALNRGEYRGKRVVSSEWIDQMTRSQISTNNAHPYGPGYGYCWWVGQNAGTSYAFANGWGGQFIVVVPDENLVVVATNQWQGVATSVANDQWYRTINLIMTNIVPAFK
jgi:CubicO group peptidase (beta-lactamase class C family)